MLLKLDQDSRSDQRSVSFGRWIAVLAALNLALVFFDLTYLSARSFYLQAIPRLVQIYDPIKGLHPHPETQRYLEQVTTLESQAAELGIGAPEVAQSLAQLRRYSQILVQDNPFPGDDTATIDSIRRSLQSRTRAESSFVAFDRFWSQEYLAQADWQRELKFWNRQIQPLLAAGYFRQVNRWGHAVDYFWLIDLPFVLIFAVDYAMRARALRRRYPELSWPRAALRRWYDLLLLIPVWRWLRVVPVTIHLRQADLLNLEIFQAEAQRNFAIGFAKDLTEVAGIQIIDQAQAAIRRGDLMRWLLYPELRRAYVEVNDLNEVEAIATRVVDIAIRQVLPQIQPDLELFIDYNLYQIFEQLPGYRQLKYVPGVNNLPKQMTERLSRNLSTLTCEGIAQIWQDPEIAKIMAQLTQNFRESLASELQKQSNTQAIENLLIEMLEEIKINYVKGITESGVQQILEEAEQLRKIKA